MAGCSLPSASVTWICPFAPATTWLLVSTLPSAVRITPLPSATPCASCTRMSTVLGMAFCAAAPTEPGTRFAEFDEPGCWVRPGPELRSISAYAPPKPAAPPTTPASTAAVMTLAMPRLGGGCCGNWWGAVCGGGPKPPGGDPWEDQAGPAAGGAAGPGFWCEPHGEPCGAGPEYGPC